MREQAQGVLDAGGQILACGTCLKIRASQGSDICPLSTLKAMSEVVRDADKLLMF